MNFLRVHLLPGSFRSSYCDTDSMCLGLSRTQPIPENATLEQYYRCLFDPLVRPEMKDSWESQWKSWFVTTDTIEDQRKPGKLKSTFSNDHSILYSMYLQKFKRNSGYQKAISSPCHRNAISHTMPIQKRSRKAQKGYHIAVILSLKISLTNSMEDRITP